MYKYFSLQSGLSAWAAADAEYLRYRFSIMIRIMDLLSYGKPKYTYRKFRRFYYIVRDYLENLGILQF